MISQTTEYALRAMVYLAEHPDGPRTVHEMATGARIPEGYLAKVMQGLARHELVRSHRGVRGGFTLARAPARLTLLEVVNAVDPIPRIHACPLGLEGHREQLCALHRRLDQAMAICEDLFRGTTLADLLVTPTFGSDGPPPPAMG